MNLDDDTDETDELLLTETETDAEVGFEEEEQSDENAVDISFADDEQEEETPLAKKLRGLLRDTQRQLQEARGAPIVHDDPEPAVPPLPESVADFDYDEDRHKAAIKAHVDGAKAHLAWESRQADRDRNKNAALESRQKRVEQQKNALGIKDYDRRSAATKDALSDQQMAVLIEGTDDPAKMIAALGGSPMRLATLAAETNLAKFAVMLGKTEKEIKVTKRQAPAPETQVRGATASLSTGPDKHLERLEREADKTGDRSKVIAYKREQREKRAA